MYIVYLHVTGKEHPAFEFKELALAEAFCTVATQAKDVQSAMICKHGAGKNEVILETWAQGCCIG